MATLNTPLPAVSPSPVPNGSVGTLALAFTTAPAQPDLTAVLSVYEDGTLVASAPAVTLTGAPAEATPVVSVGSTDSGWEIRTTAGVLTPAGDNTFTIAY